ncbi:actin-related protein 3 putative arp3 [Leptomonas pyrrhocoris]|uniref:Actin-related protein 3 putative arp3 n=1 Tax=Leptomonas pyrrhocoris TaxID=157538 RepID=A0A0N0VDE6_LEPPY|nr:actin-related protein 3 putative arp3 [Leptomonas pyrrhocoris]KPA75051.1 actin-related protein 3 putative arp3 [Leptomonas pyrrhocoris]|eukprot:XP_015653490.1 actin-related protein 3 putative arp3 [Leptomonas pyrrhocoris]
MPPVTPRVPVVVCDMGTSTTRLGYAGNSAPTFELPTVCAWADPLSYDTLHVGHEADQPSRHAVTHHRRLVDHGTVADWDLYEEYWRHLFHRHLCVESSDVGVVLTEAAKTAPEQREATAEILFESFGVPQLSMGSQALFALSSVGNGADTGLVVLSGAGMTQVVPVVDGYALDGAAQHFQIAGGDITQYVLDSLREHTRDIAAERAWDVAERVKRSYLYVAEDAAKEMAQFEADPLAHVLHHSEVHWRTGHPYAVRVGRERFLAAETMFQPALLQPRWTTALPGVMDAVVWACPMDCRRRLYANVVVCGGNMRFPGLTKRLERALRALLEKHTADFVAASNGATGKPAEYEVRVTDCSRDRNAVWKGGSLFGASARFAAEAVTRAEYQERGHFSADAA